MFGIGKHSGNHDRVYPGWTGPWLGALLGASLGARDLQNEPIVTAAVGSIAGFAGGSILWYLDRPTPVASRRSSFFGGSVAVLAVLTRWIPFLGFALPVLARLSNRRSCGWPARISRICFAFSVFVIFLVLLTIFLLSTLQRAP